MVITPNAPARHGLPQLLAVASTLAIACILLFVALVAGAVHARNMRGASLRCEVGTPTLGAWAEPDTCEGAPEGLNFAEHGPEHLLDPWTSVLIVSGIVATAGLVSLWSVARINGTTLPRAIAPLGGALVGLVMISAIAYQAMLVRR